MPQAIVQSAASDCASESTGRNRMENRSSSKPRTGALESGSHTVSMLDTEPRVFMSLTKNAHGNGTTRNLRNQGRFGDHHPQERNQHLRNTNTLCVVDCLLSDSQAEVPDGRKTDSSRAAASDMYCIRSSVTTDFYCGLAVPCAHCSEQHCIMDELKKSELESKLPHPVTCRHSHQTASSEHL